MAFRTKSCIHLDSIENVKQSKSRVCEECIKIDAEWIHLRTCQDCGATLCCDSSKYKHARKHAIRKNHPVISSAEEDERWIYCFSDGITKTY